MLAVTLELPSSLAWADDAEFIIFKKQYLLSAYSVPGTVPSAFTWFPFILTGTYEISMIPI